MPFDLSFAGRMCSGSIGQTWEDKPHCGNVEFHWYRLNNFWVPLLPRAGGDDENHMERYGNVEGVDPNTCAILCKSKGCYYALLPQTGWPSCFLSKISLFENNLQHMWNASEEPRLNWSFQFSILIWCIRVASRKPRTAGSKLPLFILSGWKAD